MSLFVNFLVVSFRSYSSSSKKLLEFLAAMPKANTARITMAQRQRAKIKQKAEKYGSTTVYLQVIGSGARGAPNTLYLFTDQKRYLFNCGESTQRLAHEHKVKLSRLDHIFITSKKWRNLGGLPGLSLTLQDVGVPNITLHGPPGLDELYNATRRFIVMKDMKVTMAECGSKDFEDSVLTIKYVLMTNENEMLLLNDSKKKLKSGMDNMSINSNIDEFINDSTDYYKPEKNHEGTRDNKHSPSLPKKAKMKESLDVKTDHKKKPDKVVVDFEDKSNCSVAYICILKKRLGTLDLAKCVEFGVKPGPLLGKLKNGLDVVLPNGTLVRSAQVKTPDDPGPVFIVLDVPDLSYLKPDDFKAHFADGNNPPENIPTVIVHYTPPHVFNHPEYHKFMWMFGPTTQHLVLNEQNSCLGSEAVHRTQHKLHLLDPDIFPLLKDVSVPAVWNPQPIDVNVCSPNKQKGLDELKEKIATAQFRNIMTLETTCKGDASSDCFDSENCDQPTKLSVIKGRTLSTFHLRPKRQLDRSIEPKLHVQEYLQEPMNVDGFIESLDQFRQLAENVRYENNTKHFEYPKIIFLGTGSCIPSKTRNTSAIVLQIDESRSLLMDCGEGTYNQLVRFFGTKRVSHFLRTLRAVYISHLHADHHIGLIGVLQARRQAFNEMKQSESVIPDPVYLLAPGQIMTWLNVYDQQFESIKDEFTLIPNQLLLHSQTTDISPAILSSIGVNSITTCYVHHCPNAFGVAIQLDEHKITYSGDTLPCDALVAIGQNSTILIHEATMEDELIDEARTKMHSTTSQAIEVGRQMCASYTVLTHFSQRYARLPRLNLHVMNKGVGIAFDNMQITMSDMELLPHMYAPLQLMFAEHCVEMEMKAKHRARIKEREIERLSNPSQIPKSMPPINFPICNISRNKSDLETSNTNGEELNLVSNDSDNKLVVKIANDIDMSTSSTDR